MLVTDLRNVAERYKGKTTDPQVSTVVYVDMFTKVCEFGCKSDLHPLRASLPWQICSVSRTHFPELCARNLTEFTETKGMHASARHCSV